MKTICKPENISVLPSVPPPLHLRLNTEVERRQNGGATEYYGGISAAGR